MTRDDCWNWCFNIVEIISLGILLWHGSGCICLDVYYNVWSGVLYRGIDYHGLIDIWTLILIIAGELKSFSTLLCRTKACEADVQR
jgi:hypothetical protein